MGTWFKRALGYILYVVLAVLIAAASVMIPIWKRTDVPSDAEDVRILSHVLLTKDGVTEEVVLPVKITGDYKESDVTIQFRERLSEEDVLYVKTVYAPLSVFIDGEPAEELGSMD